MNVPSLTATAAAAFILFEMARAPTAKEVARSSAVGNKCNSSECPPLFQIQVDRPQNTVLRDDTKGGSTLKGAFQHVKSTYLKEAHEHPGVRAVAHTIA